MKLSSKIQSVENCGDYLAIKTNGAQFQVYLLDNDIIRMRGTFKDEFAPEASYALVKTAWADKTDGLMAGERQRVKPLPLDLEEDADSYSVSTANLTLKINRDPFGFEVIDKAGNVLHKDLPKCSFLQDDLGRSYHYSTMGDHNFFYGFGEKSGELNKFKRRMRMHNTDSLGWNAAKSDPLYKMIPFYINFDSEMDIASGLYYNNSNDSTFDMDSEHSNYWHRYSYFECDGGDLDVFFIAGPTIKDVVKHYTDLTGKTAMMPKASLGYMGSTMYYTELDKDADQAILDFVDTCKKNDIPCDGFFMSSGYTTGDDGKRYVFNWNKDRFPDPQDFVNKLKEKGVLLAPNVKPGMLVTHPLAQDFADADAYIKTPDGQADQEDQYWGGAAHFVDFTSESGRATWSKFMTKQLLSLGITSIWNDNNEYEINETAAKVDADGVHATIGEVKPIMPTMMAKTAQKAIADYDPNVRPYLINRAGFAGIQRYAQTWAGDNRTSWTNVKYNIPTILGMGLSGVANQGCDIGGFDGPAPEPELFVRWVQNGIFQPRFSIHSSNDDNTVTEPWMYPSYTKYIRDAIQLRYQLIPYFYSLLHEASVTGAPIMRPLVYEFQNDPKTFEESFEFMLGSSLLVANVVDKGQTTKEVYLPKGADWYDLTTYHYYNGGQTIEVPVDLGSIPMFLRTGSIIPESKGLMNIHNDTVENLDVLVEPTTASDFQLYEDDGKTMSYKQGDFLTTDIAVKPSKHQTLINLHKQGTYDSKLKSYTFRVCCPDIAPLTIELQGKPLAQFLKFDKFNAATEGWFFDGEKRQVIIKFNNVSDSDIELSVESSVKDLISI